jgi:hypothetical protein
MAILKDCEAGLGISSSEIFDSLSLFSMALCSMIVRMRLQGFSLNRMRRLCKAPDCDIVKVHAYEASHVQVVLNPNHCKKLTVMLPD